MRQLLALLLGLCGLLMSGLLTAHPLAPSSIRLTQDAEWRCQVVLEHARVRPRGGTFLLSLPTSCQATQAGQATQRGDRVVETHEYACSGSLLGQVLEAQAQGEGWPGALLTVQLADGTRASGLLTRDAPALVVTAEAPANSRGGVGLFDFFRMGALHLLTGADHILFLFGLLWLVRLNSASGDTSTLRRTLLLTSAFAVGHTLTLAVAALGWLVMPRQLVEVGIAASLLLLALDIVRGVPGGGLGRTWPVVLCFGLLHGFGFADGLAQAGLQGSQLLAALLGFAAGLESAQVGLVLGAFLLARLVQRWRLEARRWSRALPGYALGGVAAMWCLERAFLGG